VCPSEMKHQRIRSGLLDYAGSSWESSRWTEIGRERTEDPTRTAFWLPGRRQISVMS